MTKKIYSNPLGYWKDGSTLKTIKLKKLENSEPYCVRLSENNWIPINLMVFARSCHEAEVILRQAMALWIKKNSKRGKPTSDRFKELLLRGKLEVQKVEKNQFFKIGWAVNDTIG